MAAQAAILMRAFRAANSSFHTWRAGEYDDDMSEATGSQAPPFPPGDYSDFVTIGHLEGPLARSDADAFLLPGLGTPGVPITFNIDTGPSSLQTTTEGTDCLDFTSISCWIVVTSVGTATGLVLQSLWTNVDAVAGGGDLGSQNSDDAILDGDSPQNTYRAQYSFLGAPGTALGPYNIPVRGRRHLLLVASTSGDLQGYALAMRIA